MSDVWNSISTYYSEDRSKKAVVCQDFVAHCPFVDFYENDVYINTIAYPSNSIYFAESAAKNYTLGILNVSKTA